MKILFYLQLNPVLSGGAYHYMQQALSLKRLGHEVHTVTNIAPHFKLPNNEISPGFVTNKSDFQMIFSNHYKPVLKAYDKAQQENAKLVLTMCESPNLLQSHPGRAHEGLKPEWDEYIKPISQKADGIITISKLCQSWINEWIDQKNVFVQYPKINVERAKEIAKEDDIKKEPYLIFISRLDYYKNVEWAIRAAGELGVKLVVIGGGAYQRIAQLHTYASRKNTDLDYLRWVSEGEKFRLLKEASVLLHPSSFEGFGLPPAESLYLGTPAVVADIQIMHEVYEDSVSYCSNYDQFLLETQLLLDNPEYAAEKGLEGQKHIKSFMKENSFDATMKNILETLS